MIWCLLSSNSLNLYSITEVLNSNSQNLSCYKHEWNSNLVKLSCVNIDQIQLQKIYIWKKISTLNSKNLLNSANLDTNLWSCEFTLPDSDLFIHSATIFAWGKKQYFSNTIVRQPFPSFTLGADLRHHVQYLWSRVWKWRYFGQNFTYSLKWNDIFNEVSLTHLSVIVFWGYTLLSLKWLLSVSV
jgi:hypothetical protein